MTTEEQNQLPFLKRFLIYQKERYPFLVNGLLISVFTFSAISYSRICRGLSNFINIKNFIPAAIVTVSLFFLLRILDEFKDAEEDKQFRSHLPVPRGLISFNELKWMGIITVIVQLVIQFLYPGNFVLYLLALIYMLLMGKEFFVPKWLKKQDLIYVLSHMVIIPLIDIYASAFDWNLSGVEAPKGLLWFLAVSFMNGIVIEIGRKIKNKENDEVNTYSNKLGYKKACYLYLLVICLTLLLAFMSAYYANLPLGSYVAISSAFVLGIVSVIIFLNKQTLKFAKLIEIGSGVWTIIMYLSLGAAPMISKLF